MKKLTLTILFVVFTSALFAQTDTTYLKNKYAGLGQFGDLNKKGEYTYTIDPRIAAEIVASRSGYNLYVGSTWSLTEKAAELYVSKIILKKIELSAGPWLPRFVSRIKPSPFVSDAHIPLDGERIITGPGVGSQINYNFIGGQIGFGLYTYQQKPEYDAGFKISLSSLLIKYGFLYRIINSDKQHTALIEYGDLHASYNCSSYNSLNSFGLAYKVFGVTPYWDYLNCQDETKNSREFGILTGPYEIKDIPVVMNVTIGYNYKLQSGKFLIQFYYEFEK